MLYKIFRKGEEVADVDWLVSLLRVIFYNFHYKFLSILIFTLFIHYIKYLEKSFPHVQQ